MSRLGRFHRIAASIVLPVSLFVTSCEETITIDPVDQLEVPITYEFNREGSSTVSFQGQLDRRAMLSQLKKELVKADKGEEVSALTLLNMYENLDNPFGEERLNQSSKQLKDKTILADQNYFAEFLQAAATDSKNSAAVDVDNQGAGLASRTSKGSTVLVNEKGQEYVQMIEKGLMGSVFFHQMLNVYLSDARTSSEVENSDLVEGKNYTQLEHYWDEAFGYFGAPTVIDANSKNQYWAKYANTVDRTGLSTFDSVYQNFLLGRAAIVAGNQDVVVQSRNSIREHMELITVGTALHYYNSSIDHINNLSVVGEGEFIHTISEAYMFLRAVSLIDASYNPALTPEEVNAHLANIEDMWSLFGREDVVSFLTQERDEIAAKCPVLDAVKAEL
jgi:hypothetical protein